MIHGSNFGRVPGRVGTLFSVLLVLRWEMAPLLNFCLIYVGNSLSEDNFPELYGIACNRDASVAELFSLWGDSFNWNVSFVQPAQD